ncbi:MAG TPA: hypothetical protein VMY42_23780 [Thermoguttaceae bacterium]|nr:hypothetical protein [Thermoguttaceae bacterium]
MNLFVDLQVYDGALREMQRRAHQNAMDELTVLEEGIRLAIGEVGWPAGRPLPRELLLQNAEWAGVYQSTLAFWDGNEQFRHLERERLAAIANAATYRRMLQEEENRIAAKTSRKPPVAGEQELSYRKQHEQEAAFQEKITGLLETTINGNAKKRARPTSSASRSSSQSAVGGAQ